ncbi:uncharacterized protein LOC123653788 [Melitaea cinxia]|uniref:uncharacterized protein LOC123653788 n=1 Tax=Melitaea cinxia TaxID=113334 RepID=UPI001E271732|nr:uncharacterized protein LOC123653788 [Melitaea cinxia]
MTKPIIARFISRYRKDECLAQLRKLKITAMDLGFASGKVPIHFNDHLTSNNKALLKRAKSIAKEKHYKYVWVRNCSIMARHTDTKYDIIALSETWLHPGISDMEIFDSRYCVYRGDRNYVQRGVTLGGGVLLAIGKNIPVRSSRAIDILGGIAEIVEITVKINNKVLYIYCCYFPHHTQQYDALCEFFDIVSSVVTENSESACLILGDFNISHAHWQSTDSFKMKLERNQYSDKFISALMSFLSFIDSYQFNGIFNKNNRILDLVMSNLCCESAHCSDAMVVEDPHHPALEIKVHYQHSGLESQPRIARLFHKANYDDINRALSDSDWETLYGTDSIHDAVGVFYNILEAVIVKYVPQKNFKHRDHYPPWFSGCLVKIVKEKSKYHKKWKIYGRISDYDSFRLLRKRQKEIQESCYKNFLLANETNIKMNSKNFWSFVKSKKAAPVIPNSMTYNSISLTNGSDICNIFNEYFKSVYEPSSTYSISTNYHSANNGLNNICPIRSIDISSENILKYLGALNIAKGSGPDGIPPVFYKACKEQLVKPLMFLFRKSLISGIMPTKWKESFIVPIFKSGDKHNVTNYRPISKLNTIAKMFEKIIYDSILPQIRPLIIPEQHGFVSKRSTETNLCEFIHRIGFAMDQGFQVDVIYTDYSKAFDKISHQIILNKLMALGIHGDLLRWIDSYLRHRSQAVTVKGYCSSFVPVTSGASTISEDRFLA